MIIPKIIHQIWEEKTPLPDVFVEFAKTWKEFNPSWEYVFWDKTKMNNFIQENYPDYISILEKYKYDVQRWDVIRYLILYKLGGVYVDFDYECLESLDNLLHDKDCCFGLEPEEHAKIFQKRIIISNAFIAIKPKHPFMKQILEMVKFSSSVSEEKLIYVLETTGPHMLTNLYERCPMKESISLIPSEIISPLTKMDVINYLNGMIDEGLIEKKIQKAVAIHYFWGSWS
jgi:mannosyltransferase OCH1-like enzyme